MPNVTLFNQSGSQAGDLELPATVFGITPNESVLYDAVIAQQANRRQGTQKAKTRSERRGGGAKPWRQKGTGRARHGSIRSPIWVGGGVAFAPQPRSYKVKMPKKARRLALRSAYASKLRDNELIVVDDFNLDAPKTKEMKDILTNLSANGKTLVVTADQDETVSLSARNLPGVTAVHAQEASVLEIVKHDYLVMTKGAVEKVEEVLG
ncbi:LSU ribosomal protein L4P [Salsuginibacillus halophilus]|uniref:Large ribosomal subunit protein uL4 n=1 Tax=Salsuginibacillus halophilus TaxID=517424 RepID=A0A2P8H8N2_9BACI|nr:50S ribosomal protein L4 [Salsuginibacillus halophilus]PSL42529.1 LSU ribosomal protein L4P [Salsuginibacillus halophilus]